MRTHTDVDGLETLSAPRPHALSGPERADPWTAQSPFVIGETASDFGGRTGNLTLRQDPSSGPWHLERTDATGEASETDRGDARSGEAFESETKPSCQCEAARPMRRHLRHSEPESLTSDEIIAVLGDKPAAAVLHWLLGAREPQQSMLAALLGRSHRRVVRLRGSEIPLGTYLRLLSRLCREAAEQAEQAERPFDHETESGAGWQTEHPPSSDEEWRAKDSKGAVSNTFDVPWRWICKISLRKDGKYAGGGTGVLISDQHVLTAAHVVHEVYKNRQQFDLEVTPALNGSDDLGLHVSSSKPMIPDRYVPDDKDSDYDYALIKLDTAIGAQTFKELNKQKLCFWGSPDCGASTELARLEPKSLMGKTAYTAGYPQAKGGKTMWWFSGLLHSVDEKKRVMWFTGEATEGQSGSPVWIQDANNYRMAGILVAEVVGSSNAVVRITRELCRQLHDWMAGSSATEREDESAAPTWQPEQEVDANLCEYESDAPGEHFVTPGEAADTSARRDESHLQPEYQEEQETPHTTAEQERCKRDWLNQFNALPEALRQALTQKDFNNAIVIAIHQGWRDLDKLTDLIFMADKGEHRGYCKLTNAAADAADQEYWRQKRDIVRSFMLHPSPPLAQHGSVVCRKVEFKLDVARPDLPKHDLTGRHEYRAYVKAFDAEVTSYVVNINQAGRHLEGLMTRVLRPGSDEKSRAQYRIYGDQQDDGSFLVFSTTKPADFWGYFRFDASGRLFWQNEGYGSERWESGAPLVKYSDEPTLLESAFSPQAFSPDGVVHQQEWFPLTTTQKRHLITSLSEDKIAPFLQRCFSAAQGFKADDKAAVGRECWKIWSYIEQVFLDKDKGFHPVDRVLAIHYARILLASNQWTFTSSQGQTQTRSQLDWLQDSLNRVFESGDSTPNLRNAVHAYLWLKPVDPTAKKHTYQVSASLKGFGLIGGYYRGEITIKNVGGKNWTEQTFKIVLKGFQVQLGFTIKFEGTAETSNEWLPADFPGSIDLLAASVGAKAPGIKASAGGAVLTIFGSGIREPMIATSEDADIGVNLGKKWGIDGPDLSGRWGEIRARDLPDVQGRTVHVATDHAGLYGLESDAHFCLGSALLTDDARQALRVMCANELRGFENPQSQLSILGYADTVGYANASAAEANECNGRLSLLRADNTLQAIRDILGKRFKITNIKKTGEGQKEAEKAGLAPGAADPRYRRVDVILNNTLVISLRV
jgi:V8-like Glu-specific endopeptidase